MCAHVYLAACFIETTLADVSDPLHDVVIAVVQLGLEYFQVANFETRRSKRHLSIKQPTSTIVIITIIINLWPITIQLVIYS